MNCESKASGFGREMILEGETPPPKPAPGRVADGQSRTSLRTNSLALFGADLVSLALSLVAAVVTARILLPAGKGFYSSLIFLVGLLINCFSAGLGEAAIVTSGRRGFSLPTAAAGTMAAQLPLSLMGSLVCLVAGSRVLDATAGDRLEAVLVAAVVVGLMTTYNTVVSFLMAQERLVPYAALSVALSAVTTVTIWVLAAPLKVTGAVLGSLLGAVVVLPAAALLVDRSGIPLRPRRVPGYLRRALPVGAAVQFSNLLILVAGRMDLLLVYRIGDPAMAGRYSVALTIGALVGSVPIALSHASFPRLARLEDPDARSLVASVFRGGMAAAAGVAIVLSLCTPIMVPIVFGSPYRDAIGPSVILLMGALPWSGQWLLARAAVACGMSRPLVTSFGLSVVAMVGLDLLLIPVWGLSGAALASAIASTLGFAVAALECRHLGWRGGDFVPRLRDVFAVAAVLRQSRGRSSGRPLLRRR